MRRILAIDGGGLKGLFPASVLASWQEQLSHPIGSYFDLIVGTSTGGILALALGMRVDVVRIAELYSNQGPAIFPRPRMRFGRWLLKAKYDVDRLRQELDGVFGDAKLGDSKTRLVIPALSKHTAEVHLFKTAHHVRFATDYKEPLVEVALATSAAPTFFPHHVLRDGTTLLDGGIWANNPSAVAAVEALGVLGWRPADTHIISLGCTSEPFNPKTAFSAKGGLIHYAYPLKDFFMRSQSSAAIGMSQHLIGKTNYCRIDRTTPQGWFALDALKSAEALRGLASQAAREHWPDVAHLFVAPVSEPFEPFH